MVRGMLFSSNHSLTASLTKNKNKNKKIKNAKTDYVKSF